MGLTSGSGRGRPLKAKRVASDTQPSGKKLGSAPHAGFGGVGWGYGPPGVNRLHATEMDPNRISKAR